MSGEAITVWGTQKVLESSGALIANGAVGGATTSYSVETDGLGFPDAEFVLTATFSAAPLDGGTILLYARPLDVDGTADTEVPEAYAPRLYLGYFQVNNVTTPQSITLGPCGLARDIPRKAEFYLFNSGSGTGLTAGWTLKITPRSYKVAP